MTKPHLLIPMIAALLAAPVAQAQEATTTEAETAAPAADADAGDGVTGLDTGTPVNPDGTPAGQEPRTYVKEQIGDWDLQCLRNENGEEPCQLYQLLQDDQGNSVAEVSLFKLAAGGQVEAGATFVVPLETLLTEKMTIQVDAGQAKRYDYSFCTPVGCYARVGFTAQDIAGFKAGNVAKITIVPALAPDQKVTVEMSLTGFTKGYGAVTPVNRGG